MAHHKNGRRETFLDRVMAATPGGDALITCLQCGTCGGSCPSAADMDATPRRLFAMIAQGSQIRIIEAVDGIKCLLVTQRHRPACSLR